MKVLLACEESQIATMAFRQEGHEAYSCDILPTSGPHPEWHYQTQAENLIYQKHWELIIAFPPCTDLAVSGARWFKTKRNQPTAIHFFKIFTELQCKWAIENPIGIMSTHYRKPDQIIQPWQFGHGETKATCLWLNKLPKLIPTHIVKERIPRIHHMPPSPNRGKLRSKTYPGIAMAMAKQWTKPYQHEMEI